MVQTLVELEKEKEAASGAVGQTRRWDGVARGRHVSHVWAAQPSECLVLTFVFQVPVRRRRHINLHEAAAYTALLQRPPRDPKMAMGQDSKVTIGAAAHGRSGSPRLNAVLSAGVPYILGKNFHPSSYHVPTWSLRADEVSRYTQIREPRMGAPQWL